MSGFAVGQVLSGDEGRVHIRIRAERYYICPEELGMLLFVGDRVPLLKKSPDPRGMPWVAGSVYLNPSGRAVIIAIGETRYLLPRDRFLAVALGEDVSCILFEIPSDEEEPKIDARVKGGAKP
jgi:hypothetical protein